MQKQMPRRELASSRGRWCPTRLTCYSFREEQHKTITTNGRHHVFAVPACTLKTSSRLLVLRMTYSHTRDDVPMATRIVLVLLILASILAYNGPRYTGRMLDTSTANLAAERCFGPGFATLFRLSDTAPSETCLRLEDEHRQTGLLHTNHRFYFMSYSRYAGFHPASKVELGKPGVEKIESPHLFHVFVLVGLSDLLIQRFFARSVQGWRRTT
jgi:hypothetical protein